MFHYASGRVGDHEEDLALTAVRTPWPFDDCWVIDPKVLPRGLPHHEPKSRRVLTQAHGEGPRGVSHRQLFGLFPALDRINKLSASRKVDKDDDW